MLLISYSLLNGQQWKANYKSIHTLEILNVFFSQIYCNNYFIFILLQRYYILPCQEFSMQNPINHSNMLKIWLP